MALPVLLVKHILTGGGETYVGMSDASNCGLENSVVGIEVRAIIVAPPPTARFRLVGYKRSAGSNGWRLQCGRTRFDTLHVTRVVWPPVPCAANFQGLIH